MLLPSLPQLTPSAYTIKVLDVRCINILILQEIEPIMAIRCSKKTALGKFCVHTEQLLTKQMTR